MSPQAPPARPTSRGASALLAAAGLAALCLSAFYVTVSGALAGGADVLAFSSGIFDMDVARVVADLATERSAFRASVHPLQKLIVAPIGAFLNAQFFGGANALGAARIVIAVCMALQTLAAAALAWQLTRRSLSAAVAAGCLVGFSFSTWLAASIPESAAVACLSATLPLLLLNERWGRRFGVAEAFAWAGLAALGLGLTLTQLVHCVIALGVRLTLARDHSASTPTRVPWRPLAATLALFAALFASGLTLQARLYPPRATASSQSALATELHFMRVEELSAAPFSHTGRLLAHFFVFDFVAPFPGYSDFLIRDYQLDYWSLSVEEAGIAQWAPAQCVLAGAVLLALLAAASGLRGADARFLAPILCVSSQLGLHMFYGREYVLYSPHWHGVLVALLVAAAWRRFPRRQGAMLTAAVALAAGMLINDVVVMRSVYGEVEAGLSTGVRDAAGFLLERG